MRILYLSSWYPYPPNNGSKLRIYNLLRGLAQHHEVTLLSFTDHPNTDPDSPELGSLCRQVQVIPAKSFESQSWRARLGFFSLSPRSVVATFSPEMKRRIAQAISVKDHDVIIASEIGMAVYSKYFGPLPALLDELQVGVPYQKFTQARSFKHRWRHGFTWVKHKRFVATMLKNFQACTVVSAQERQLLYQAVPDYHSVEVIPNCVDLLSYDEIREMPQPDSLIFTGSFSFTPNYEAMVWFLRSVYPRIQTEVPNVSLTITGNHLNKPLPPRNKVTLAGFVDDVRPFIASAWVSLAPIQEGGGTRLKILEAMALRTPVVATSKGAEGLDVTAGEHLLIADTPKDFAAATIRLLKEPGLRQRLAANAYQLVAEKYDWAAVMPQFLSLVDRVACDRPS